MLNDFEKTLTNLWLRLALSLDFKHLDFKHLFTFIQVKHLLEYHKRKQKHYTKCLEGTTKKF